MLESNKEDGKKLDEEYKNENFGATMEQVQIEMTSSQISSKNETDIEETEIIHENTGIIANESTNKLQSENKRQSKTTTTTTPALARKYEQKTRSRFLLNYAFCFIGNGSIDWFPYIFFKHRAPFLVLYWFIIFLITFPLLSLEVALGKFTSSGSIGLAGFSKLFRGAGIALAWMCLLIILPDLHILSKVLYYDLSSWKPVPAWTSEFSSPNNSNQTDFLQGSAYDFYQETKRSYVELTVCMFFTAFFVWAVDLKIRGISVFRTYVYPFMFFSGYVFALVLLIKVYSTGDATDSNKEYSDAEAMDLFDPHLWAKAASIAFYKIDLYGIPAALASKEGFNNDLSSPIILTVLLDFSTSCLFCFIAVGFMSIAEQRLGEGVVPVLLDQEFLIKYPIIFSAFETPGVWGSLFFIIRYIFTIGSTIIYIDTCVLAVNDLYPKTKAYRTFVRLGLCVLIFLVSLSFTLPNGNIIFTIWTDVGNTRTSIVIYVVYLILLAWVYGADSFLDDIEFMRGNQPIILHVPWKFIRSYLKIMWKYVTAPTLFFLFVYDIVQGNYSINGETKVFQMVLQYSPVIIFFVIAIEQFASSKGTFKQRMEHLVKPTTVWGPADPKLNSKWLKQKRGRFFPQT